MIRHVAALLAFSLLLLPVTGHAADTEEVTQTPLVQKPAQAKSYPSIVLYSVAWCRHCKEAKEYMTTHDIPFINKDVELDAKALEELTGRYKSQSVPVIVIGNDTLIIRGFSPEKFEQALKEVGR